LLNTGIQFINDEMLKIRHRHKTTTSQLTDTNGWRNKSSTSRDLSCGTVRK